ncbi:hypothetical protein BC827DRAFT_898654 [Russula dissimulans]|nr:hypothetical protein BC827DRAFT_898654 [Russula dissimulans]
MPARPPAPACLSAHQRTPPATCLPVQSLDTSAHVTCPLGDGKRPLTTRQAVLASVVRSSHVSLDETSCKKKQVNETEITLRREETARKRKHLSEKKLEDEKAETINHLRKKNLAHEIGATSSRVRKTAHRKGGRGPRGRERRGGSGR